MKKTKLLTSLAALSLVLGLGACEVNVGDVNINGGEVDLGDDGSSEDKTDEDTSEDATTSETTSEDDTSGSTSGGNEGVDDGLAHNPAELMEKIYNENNYHITLYYDAYETDEDYRITYGTYLDNSTYYWYYLQTYVDVEYYAYDIYYMEDALLIDEYMYNGYYYAATGYEVIFYDYGDGNSVYRWTTSNGYNFSGSYWYPQYRLYDIVYSMMLAYSYYEVQDGFSYTNSGTDYYGDNYDLYDLDSTSALYLFTCLGTEFLFGSQDACINAAYSFDFDGAYFYEESQSVEVDYWTYGLYTDDETATSDSIVYFGEYIIEAVIDDVGTTTDYGYCQYMSNYFLGIN